MNLSATLVPKVCLKWSFFGLESVLNPIGKDTKKPQNYLIVCGFTVFSPILVGLGCGKTGIRTLGTRKGTTVFETVPIDHSGIFPRVLHRKGTKVFRHGEIFSAVSVTECFF